MESVKIPDQRGETQTIINRNATDDRLPGNNLWGTTKEKEFYEIRMKNNAQGKYYAKEGWADEILLFERGGNRKRV